MKYYTPRYKRPLNLDLTDYERPSADKSILYFGYAYCMLGAILIVMLIFADYVNFVARYKVLVEVSAGILLFLGCKCGFAYAKNYNKLLRWDLVAATIVQIDERDDSTSSVKLSFFPTNEAKPFNVIEDFNFPIVDKIKELDLNALPLFFQPNRYEKGAYYVDLRFKNGELDTSNLKAIKNLYKPENFSENNQE